MLFRIDHAAGCSVATVSFDSPALGLGSNAANASDKDSHADLTARFEFTCKTGSRAGFVEVGLFDAFAALKRIELHVGTPRGQVKATLMRPASRVVLVR